MVCCFVPGCTSSTYLIGKGGGVTFHRIPINMCDVWLSAIGKTKEDITNISFEYIRICSDHFKREDFRKTPSKTVLKKDVIPTQNLLRTPPKKAAPTWHRIPHGLRRKQKYVFVQENLPTTFLSSSDESGIKVLHHTYNNGLSPSDLDEHISSENIRNYEYKCQFARERNIRKITKIVHLRQTLSIVKKKYALSINALEALEKSFSDIPLFMMKRIIKNIIKRSRTTFPTS